MAKNKIHTLSATTNERIVYTKPAWYKRIFTKQKSASTQSLKARLFHWFWKIILWFFIVSIGLTVLYKFLPIPFTLTMANRKIDAVSNGEDSEIYYSWIAYQDISKEAALSVVAAEDQFFPQHHGFDFTAMQTAFKGNLKGKRLKGASTLSQQVAKNVFLWQGRSYFRKFLEAYFTVLIEFIWGKERILEVYLNVAETGKMTFGFEEASLKYFGHSANTLSRKEAAKIAAVLPSPLRYSVTSPSNYVSKRGNFIARQMRALGGKTYVEFK
jgi:monofunctional glycosyltransferase